MTTPRYAIVISNDVLIDVIYGECFTKTDWMNALRAAVVLDGRVVVHDFHRDIEKELTLEDLARTVGTIR